jgi:hypothetical protein
MPPNVGYKRKTVTNNESVTSGACTKLAKKINFNE